VSISVEEGEIFGLLGPNGAGKTTLISVLAGILTPDEGKAEISGLDCTKESKKVQEHFNVVSGFTGVLFWLSCEEALMYYCLIYNVKNPKKRIEEVIAATNLEEARRLSVEDFSSGMKQRFLIAKALLNDPKIIILDEPTVGLDVESALSVREIIARLRSEGRTILLTTHNMFEAEELCNRVSFINRGRIIGTGPVEKIKEKFIGKRLVEINCSDAEEVVASLSKIKGVIAGKKSRRTVHVAVDSYKKMKTIMRALSQSGSEIFSVSALEPTLQETYLKIMENDNHD
jgi:ABC-2 type transport system ATP-binding protein